jgi:hypothetical protein
MKKTRRDIFFLLAVIATVLSVFTPGEIFVAAPAVRREDEELRYQSTEVNPSGGILQGLADLIIGYTVKDVSPTKMKYSGSGPGTVELCATPNPIVCTAFKQFEDGFRLLEFLAKFSNSAISGNKLRRA